ncbi:SPOR domain-containing protein [Flavobacteriaceae bacterium F08102]|nr:SPOR domain-containing protein [Flavobacteriaceae bacterium F08102]
MQAQSEGGLTVHSSEKIKKVIAKKLAYNKSIEQVSGFRIQLFYGSEEGARKTGEEFLSLFPEGKTKLQFDSPDWKLMVGNYKTKLEADRALVEIKEAFVTAIIVPAMVDIERE